MKQLLQNIQTGETSIVESPAPKVGKNSVLISSNISLVSIGTEKMVIDFAKASYIEKAMQKPDKVKMVIDKVKSDGILSTVDAVRSKLQEPIPLGYSNVGIVKEIGANVNDFSVGDRVISNGYHSNIVRVPENLCAKIPDNVDDESAAFVVLGSIGLQGVRLAKPSIGEYFVVTGVGLVGLLVVQILIANGCKVLAIDFDERKLKLAKRFGADICNPSAGQDPVESGLAFSNGRGVDGAIITAATTSNDPVSQAAKMSRKRGRIILVGVTGLNLDRADFYEKELSFQVSCSYGPGRYDPEYEQKGNDYPIGFVRWTEKRNFEAILDMLSNKKVDFKSLITHRIKLEDAPQMYKDLGEKELRLGTLINYENKESIEQKIRLKDEITNEFSKKNDIPCIGFIGAGGYASKVLIPSLKKTKTRLHTLASSGGLNASIVGRKNSFENASSNTDDIFNNKDIDTIFIATRHDTHAELVLKAIESQKNIFVEKPLAITKKEHESITDALKENNNSKLHLMVGFNRRFSPHIKKMKNLIKNINEPKSFIMTMNAGFKDNSDWTQDRAIGGGRIIGEACHYIDLMRFLAGSPIVEFSARSIGKSPRDGITEDKSSITLAFEDGSFGTIFYLANGANSFPKERIEVFSGGKILQLDNFRNLKGYGWHNFKKMRLFRQDKGNAECVKQFINGIISGSSAIPLEEILEVSNVTLDISEMLRNQN
ncbi:MAG: dehydrogenase [Dehalococcoidia bacterium]|nr:dehydrogenase [Dehalococcoidia bacterium]|tara:strand:- start:7161 stop:9299 length:2139 start_codon:yes stop_codon:yes gene_type:complete